jgi:hypothetical protein
LSSTVTANVHTAERPLLSVAVMETVCTPAAQGPFTVVE